MMEEANIVGLVDRGYQHKQLVRPDDLEMAKALKMTPEDFSSQQAKHRAPVEIMNTIAKYYNFASQKVSQPPEFQAFALMTIYYLSAVMMFEMPTALITRLMRK